MASLVQKFKAFTDISSNDITRIYDALYIQKILVKFHPNFTLYADGEDILVLDVQQKEVLTYIEFHENHMLVNVSRDFTDDEVNSAEEFILKYDATSEWLFQLSTIHDLGFIENRYMKYLNKLRDLYSTDYD